MSVSRIIFKNITWLAASELFSKAVGFILVILITRYLGVEGYGQYTFAMSFVMFFAFLADFGFGPYLTREISKKPDQTERLVNSIFGAKVLFVLLAYLLILASLPFLHKPGPILALVAIAGFNITLNSFQVFFKAIFQGHEQMKYESFSRFWEKIIWFVATILVILFDLGIHWLIIAAIAGTGAKLIASSRFLKHFLSLRLSFGPKAWKFAIKESVFFTLINFFFILYFKIDAVMLSFLKGDQETGLYGSAYDLIYALAFIPIFMSVTVYPVLSRFYEHASEKLAVIIPRVLKYFFLLGLPIVLFLLLFSNEIIKTMYPPRFNGAIPMFQTLSIAFFFGFLNYPLNLFMGALHLQRISAIAIGAAAVLNIGLNIFLIPQFGGVGAASATVITEFTLLFFSLAILQKGYPILSYGRLKRIFGLAFLFVFFLPVFLILDANITIKISIGGMMLIAYPLLIFALSLIGEHDRRYAIEIFSKKPIPQGEK